MYSTKYDAENRLWSGYDLPPLFNPNISLGQVLQKFMKAHGSKLAQVHRKKCASSTILFDTQKFIDL